MVLIGAKIKELRNSCKFTQKELADLVGVTKSTIAAYENDSRTPSFEVLIKLATVFHVATDTILLNRSGSILEVDGLTPEQIHIIKIIIDSFCKSNLVTKAFEDNSLDILETMLNFKRIADEQEPLIEKNMLELSSDLSKIIKKKKKK